MSTYNISDRSDSEPCPLCKRKGAKTSKEAFLIKYDSLLKEIDEKKGELGVIMKNLEELDNFENSSNHEPIQQIFNVQNYKVLQKILEEAEHGDDVLLFADQNRCTWQIINRKDLNSKTELNEQDIFAMEEIEDKSNKMIKGKHSHPVINVDKIESEYSGNEKEERVVIIESLENGDTEEKKDEN